MSVTQKEQYAISALSCSILLQFQVKMITLKYQIQWNILSNSISEWELRNRVVSYWNKQEQNTRVLKDLQIEKKNL